MDLVVIILNTLSKNSVVIELLKKEYEVELFYRAIEAYTFIHSGHIPDLIITDDELADIDVNELVCRFKNSSYYSEIPVLILQQPKNSDLVDRLLKNGADDYVASPIDEEIFLISVQNLLLKQKF